VDRRAVEARSRNRRRKAHALRGSLNSCTSFVFRKGSRGGVEFSRVEIVDDGRWHFACSAFLLLHWRRFLYLIERNEELAFYKQLPLHAYAYVVRNTVASSGGSGL